ncbi:MAG: hypothetical protein KJZ87_13615, partial [Thermoguttaceae bacterium]|nr:hypothetical protein [Thermoguttaceae bacterium]
RADHSQSGGIVLRQLIAARLGAQTARTCSPARVVDRRRCSTEMLYLAGSREASIMAEISP